MEKKDSRWRTWLQGANMAIYSCHFLASWSGRMWAFASGLFFISISPDSLTLMATYGLTMGICVLLFGTIIGNWVDKTPRIKAALRSMILQNIFVVVSACSVLILLFLLSETGDLNQGLLKFLYAIIIGSSVVSRLLKVARVIVVERDWIVEISRQNGTDLSVMTSTFRRIDLLTKILAPIFTGQIMTYAGLKISCGVISVWSLVSLYVEYRLLRRVYTIVPALRAIKDASRASSTGSHMLKDVQASNLNDDSIEVTDKGNETKRSKSFSPMRIFDSFVILFRGFCTYNKYTVKWAGLALACLYMTVLGFDGITVGYATTQGMSGSILGIVMGTGAVFGITATFTFPVLVRRLGLAKTGVLALTLQLSCLSLCVVSVWLPGSPFDPAGQRSTSLDSTAANVSLRNCSLDLGMNDSTYNTSSSSNLFNTSDVPCRNHSPFPGDKGSNSMVSVWVMLIGIITARFGLWTADLAIIQLFLERVVPTERGIINGFQSSLNQLMDFFKYALVVAIPLAHQFGLLIFISYFSIITGWALMFIFAIRSKRSTGTDLEPRVVENDE